MHEKSRRSRGFFSIDASFAILIIVLSFSMFSLLSSSAASFAAEGAKDVSKTNTALRLSSYILDDAAAGSGGIYPNNYATPGELSEDKLQPFILQPVLSNFVSQGGLQSAEVSVKGSAIPIAVSSAGTQAGEKYCVQRMALLEGEIVLLEVCIS